MVREMKHSKIEWLRFQAGRMIQKDLSGKVFKDLKVPVFKLLGWGETAEEAKKMASGK